MNTNTTAKSEQKGIFNWRRADTSPVISRSSSKATSPRKTDNENRIKRVPTELKIGILSRSGVQRNAATVTLKNQENAEAQTKPKEPDSPRQNSVEEPPMDDIDDSNSPFTKVAVFLKRKNIFY